MNSSMENKLSAKDLPPSLLSVGPKDLEYLQQDEVLLKTTRALIYDSHSMRHELNEDVHKNLDKADQLESRLRHVQNLRSDVAGLQSDEIEAKKEWQRTDAQMRSIVEPFTKEGVYQRICGQIKKMERYVEEVQNEIFRRNNLPPEESIVLARRYAEACKNLQLLERTRDGLDF